MSCVKFTSFPLVAESFELNKLYEKKQIADTLMQMLQECGLKDIKVSFRGAGGRSGGGAGAAGRKIDDITEEFFKSLKIPVGWKANGMNAYIRYSKVKMLNGENFKQTPDFDEAVAMAHEINTQWKNLKDTEPHHAMFFSKFWKTSVPPVQGIIRNKLGYCLRSSGAVVAERKPCQSKKDKQGNYMEGLYSWGLSDCDAFLSAQWSEHKIESSSESESEPEQNHYDNPSENAIYEEPVAVAVPVAEPEPVVEEKKPEPVAEEKKVVKTWKRKVKKTPTEPEKKPEPVAEEKKPEPEKKPKGKKQLTAIPEAEQEQFVNDLLAKIPVKLEGQMSKCNQPELQEAVDAMRKEITDFGKSMGKAMGYSSNAIKKMTERAIGCGHPV